MRAVRLAQALFAVSAATGAGGQARSSVAAAQTLWEAWGSGRLG